MLKDKEIRELVEAGILSKELQHRILEFYAHQRKSDSNRLFIVFGILGAILAGLGIILIIAHNWDQLSRGVKTTFAFIPLLAGQAACVYALSKNVKDKAWNESASTFLILAFGAVIALISQIYNIPGDFGQFLFNWILVSIPLIYIMNSSMASLLVIAGITIYAVNQSEVGNNAYRYWILFLLIIPHYYLLYKINIKSNFLIFHHWFVPVSLAIALATLSHNHEEYLFPGYMSLCGSFILTGGYLSKADNKFRNNGYLFLGSMGTIVILLILSYDDLWQSFREGRKDIISLAQQPEFFSAFILTALAGGIYYTIRKTSRTEFTRILEPVFIIFIPVFFLGILTPFGAVLVNILLLGIGILFIRSGNRLNHLGYLNFGLILLVALALCRFFDTSISFVIRGMIFLSVGIGFFLLNLRMINKRKSNAK